MFDAMFRLLRVGGELAHLVLPAFCVMLAALALWRRRRWRGYAGGGGGRVEPGAVRDEADRRAVDRHLANPFVPRRNRAASRCTVLVLARHADRVHALRRRYAVAAVVPSVAAWARQPGG